MLLCFAYHTINRGNFAYAWVLKLEKKFTFFWGENDAEWYYNHANMEYTIWHTESPFWDRPREVGWGQGRIKTTACDYLGGCTLSERLRLFVQDNTGKHASGVDSYNKSQKPSVSLNIKTHRCRTICANSSSSIIPLSSASNSLSHAKMSVSLRGFPTITNARPISSLRC